MKKILHTMLFLLFTAEVTYSQDVIYTISGELNNQKVSLDSIMVENLSNNTWMTFNNLPDEQVYQINLTKKAFWGTVGITDINNGTGFIVVQNLPGSIILSFRKNTPEKFNLSIYNIAGQKIYSESNKLIYPGNSIKVQPGATGVYLVSIETPKATQSFKVIGQTLNTVNRIEIFEGTPTLTPTKSAEYSVEENFAFNKGDSIRVSVFKSNNFASPLKRKLNISENLKFIFEDLSDSTRMVTTGKLQLNTPGLDFSELKVLSSIYESDVNINGSFQIPNDNFEGIESPVFFSNSGAILFGAIPISSNGISITMDEVLLYYFNLFPDIMFLSISDTELLKYITSDSNYEALISKLNNAIKEETSPTKDLGFIQLIQLSSSNIVALKNSLKNAQLMDTEFRFEYKRNGEITWSSSNPSNAYLGVEFQSKTSGIISRPILLKPYKFIFSPSSIVQWGLSKFTELTDVISGSYNTSSLQIINEGDYLVSFTNGNYQKESSSQLFNKVERINNQSIVIEAIMLVVPRVIGKFFETECGDALIQPFYSFSGYLKDFVLHGENSLPNFVTYLYNLQINYEDQLVKCHTINEVSKRYAQKLLDDFKIIDALSTAESCINMLAMARDFYLSNIGDSETRHFYNGVLYGDLSFDSYSDDLFKGAFESEHEYSRKVVEKNYKYKIDRSLTETTFTKMELTENAAEIPFDAKVLKGNATPEKSSIETDAKGDAILKMIMGTEPSEIEIATPFQISGLKDTIDLYLTDPTTLEIVSGNGQTGQMGEYLNDSVVVIARDKDGKPVPGVTVQFYTECDDCGSLDPINKKTDKKGMFAAKWWLGKTEGTKYAKAKFLIYDDIPPVTFTATAKNIVPSFIYVESGNYQQPKTNQFLDKPVKVKVVDKNGTPVKGASVHFEPGCDDCGVTENTILQTDKNGIAQTRWKIGNQKITNKLKAEVMNYPDIQPVYFYTGDGNNLRQQLIDMSPWKEVFDNGDYWLLYFTENSLKYEEYDKKNGAWELTDSFTNNWGIISDGSIFIEEEDDDDDNFIFRVNITGKTLTISFFCIDNSLVDDDDCDDGVEAILTSQK